MVKTTRAATVPIKVTTEAVKTNQGMEIKVTVLRAAPPHRIPLSAAPRTVSTS
jgi:hypothetical protein